MGLFKILNKRSGDTDVLAAAMPLKDIPAPSEIPFDSEVVHNTGNENVDGSKFFRDQTYFGDSTAYVSIKSNGDIIKKSSGSTALTTYSLPSGGGTFALKSDVDGKADASHTHSSIESPNGIHALELSNSGTATITGAGAVTATDATYDLSSFETGVSVTVRWPLGATDLSSSEIVGSVGIANPSYTGYTIYSDDNYWGELTSLIDPDSLTAMFFVLSAGTTTGPVTTSSTVSVQGPATVQTDANLVTSISSSSTDSQYPSANAVKTYVDDVVGDVVGDIASVLDEINGEVI